ncbi:MAG: NlpC/P60 family protein [bacterium]
MRAIASITVIFLLTSLCVIVPETVSARPLTHTVRPGENLYRIALRYGVTVEAIARANGLRDPERIRAGQVLTIPTAPPPRVGTRVVAPQPLRIRRGPKSFFATLALVAADTPLHIVREQSDWYEVRLPDGETGWVHQDDLDAAEALRPLPSSIRGGDIAREAIRYLGTPYRWGGQTSGGVDCSGFVFIVYSRVPGMARLRSYDYFQMGAPVQAADLAPGDLVFFTTYAPGPSHVGIYLGNGKFIHAASGAGRVMMNALDDSYYASRYLGARRILNP